MRSWNRCSVWLRAARPRRGLSLVELTMAIAVLSAGVFGALHLHMRAMDGIRVIQEERIALGALSDALERVRAGQAAPLEPGAAWRIPAGETRLERLHAAEGWVRVRAGEVPGLVEVTASVDWTGWGGRPRTRSLSTLQRTPRAALSLSPGKELDDAVPVD